MFGERFWGMNSRPFTRREILKTWCGQAGALSCLAAFGGAAESLKTNGKSCILLWMSGGASQLETFDPKPGVENGGPTTGIETSVSGITIAEHLPRMAKQMEHLAVIRSMKTKEGDHSRAMQHLHTGYQPVGPLVYPTFGSLVAKERGNPDADLPSFVSIAPVRNISPQAHTSGFLGAEYAPMIVGSNRAAAPNSTESDYEQIDAALRVENLTSAEAVGLTGFERRQAMLKRQEERFQKNHPDLAVLSHRDAYQKAARLMRSSGAAAFKLDEESVETRDKYGKTQFGQSCLLARRLVERGVPFVEVTMSDAMRSGGLGWDTHQNNFEAIKPLCATLDQGWDALLTDLRERGLLDRTLVVWMGEFGRTPKINEMGGRDHFPDAWSTVLSGGGIHAGQVVGKTSNDGMTVEDRPVAVPDFLATICAALEIDAKKQNISGIGRPISIVDEKGETIREIVG